MKNKIYFLISSAVQIVCGVFAIMNASKLAQTLSSFDSFYPDGMQERTEALFNNGGHSYIILLASLAIILNILIIYLTLTDKLLKKRGTIVTCSVISFISSMYSIAQLFAILNIVVIMAMKRERPEDFPDKKEKLPVLEKEKVTSNKIIMAIILLVLYFSQFLLDYILPDKGIWAIIPAVLFYVLIISFSIIFFKDLLDYSFSEFKNNFKAYVQNLMPLVGKYYLVYFGVAMISALLAKEGAMANQSAVEALPIFVSLPLAVLYAPLVEETLFRGCIRRFIKNDKVFIIVSGVVFGLLHTAFSEASIYNVFVVAFPYAAMGSFLAYLYVKTNNICTNMAFHAFHNSIAMIISIIIKGLFII